MPERVTILYVDDEQPNLDLFELTVGGGYRVLTAQNADEGLALMDHEEVGIVVTDQVMPGMDGVDFLARVFTRHPDTVRIVITAHRDVGLLLGAVNAGHVNDYVLKPWEPRELRSLLDRAADKYLRSKVLELMHEERDYLAHEIRARYDPELLVGAAGGLAKVMEIVEAVAPTNTTVLITGESGTGKELVARAIHALSARCQRTIIKVDCASLEPNLLASELFGHEKGAFTSASSRRRGRFELAHEGTLFLDEIADLPIELQPALLRVLQDRELERLGSEQTIKVDVRVIASTNRSLEQSVNSGTFRRDLFYRLNVVPIHLPPLRQRLGDLEDLVNHFLRKHGGWRAGSFEVTKEAYRLLRRHSWPGNVRELENVVERALLLSKSEVLDIKDFVLPRSSAAEILPPIVDKGDGGRRGGRRDLRAVIESARREELRRALVAAGGNIASAARQLGLPRSTFRSRLIRYALL